MELIRKPNLINVFVCPYCKHPGIKRVDNFNDVNWFNQTKQCFYCDRRFNWFYSRVMVSNDSNHVNTLMNNLNKKFNAITSLFQMSS